MTGFNDWQSYPQQVGDAFQYGVLVTNSTQIVDTIVVSQWAGLDIYMFHPTLDCELTLAWITTTPTGNSVWTETFVSQAGVESIYHAANHGEFVQVAVISTATSGSLNLRLSPHNRPLAYQPAQGSGLLGGTLSEVVGAGVTVTHDILPYRGPARLHVNSGATAGNLILNCLDFTRVVLGRLWELANQQQLNEVFYLPSLINQLSFTNNDGVNRTYRWSMVAIL